MKTIRLFLFAIFAIQFTQAQQGINYKALIKDNNGNIVANQTIDIRFTIIADTGPTNVYQETHTGVSTDANGICIVNIGEGTPNLNTFTNVNWASDGHSLQVEIDIEQDASFVDLGTTPFAAVPYALSVSSQSIKINDLLDGKSDDDGLQNGSSLFLGIGAGNADLGSDNKNTGVGYQALLNNTGDINSAFGHQSLVNNTSGIANSAFGGLSLYSNTDGFRNSAFGYRALLNNDSADDNAAFGYNALFSNISGNQNSAFGSSSLESNLGFRNSVFGYKSLTNNTSGNNNSVFGCTALINNIGSNNCAFGYQAGISNIDGNNNVFIGTTAGALELGSNKLYIENTNADAFNALIYGEFDNNLLRVNGQLDVKNILNVLYTAPSGVALRVNGDEAIWYNGTYFSWGFGGTANYFADNVGIGAAFPNVALDVTGSIEYTGTITDVSDQRLKENFKPIDSALANITKVNTYTYNMKDDADKKIEYGVIAQELQKVFPDMVSVVDKEKGYLGVSYIQLIPVLLEAIKEQQEVIEVQNNKINNLTEEKENTNARLIKIEQLLSQISQ